MENDAATVSLRAEKAFEPVPGAEFGSDERRGDRTDRLGADFEGDRSLRSGRHIDLGFVLQGHVERRQTGRGEAQCASLDDLGCQFETIQREPIRQAAASCGARRDSSRSTVFIMTDGVVSAWLLTTVR